MKLTSENVTALMHECLFREGESTANAVVAQAIRNNYGFHPDRLAARADDIRSMLTELPSAFRQDEGGGYTFLHACVTDSGEQWSGDHAVMEQLVALGLAIKAVAWCLPRGMWSALPGGMPYFMVKTAPKIVATATEEPA